MRRGRSRRRRKEDTPDLPTIQDSLKESVEVMQGWQEYWIQDATLGPLVSKEAYVDCPACKSPTPKGRAQALRAGRQACLNRPAYLPILRNALQLGRELEDASPASLGAHPAFKHGPHFR